MWTPRPDFVDNRVAAKVEEMKLKMADRGAFLMALRGELVAKNSALASIGTLDSVQEPTALVFSLARGGAGAHPILPPQSHQTP